MGTSARTINDLFHQMERVSLNQEQTNQILERILAVVDRIAGEEAPYTQEEYAAWRKPFGEAILSVGLERRAQNALIKAAGRETAHRYFLSHSGRLMTWPEWVQFLQRNPQRALHIPGIGQRTIDKLTREE